MSRVRLRVAVRVRLKVRVRVGIRIRVGVWCRFKICVTVRIRVTVSPSTLLCQYARVVWVDASHAKGLGSQAGTG